MSGLCVSSIFGSTAETPPVSTDCQNSQGDSCDTRTIFYHFSDNTCSSNENSDNQKLELRDNPLIFLGIIE